MTRKQWPLYAVWAGITGALTAPFWFWRGGMLELESLTFIRQYLDGRSVLHKVFDPYGNDFKTYQARELSYFIDFLDAQVFKRALAFDWHIFVPLSSVIASLLTVAVIIRSLRRYPWVSSLTAALLTLLFVSNYIFLITMSMFYRSSKPLLMPLVIATTFYVAMILADRSKSPAGVGFRRWTQGLAVFGLFTLMSLLDRQGFFFALLGTAFIACHVIRVRGRWDLLLCAAVAIGLNVLYNVDLGPSLVHAINGYTPTLDYQDVPKDQLWGFKIYAQGTKVLEVSLQVLLGSLPGMIGSLIFFAVAGLAIARMPSGRLLAFGTLFVLLISQVVLFAMMISRLPAIYEWGDHRYYYYPLPSQALAFALLLILFARASEGWPKARFTIINVLLALVIVSNVAHWTGYREFMRTQRWFPRIYTQNELLKASIAARQPDPALIRQYREFYDLMATMSPALRSSPAPGDAPGNEPSSPLRRLP